MSLRILDELRTRARAAGRKIALGDASDPRMLLAAREATDDGIAEIALIGSRHEIERAANDAAISLSGISISDPKEYESIEVLALDHFELRKAKFTSIAEAREELLINPLLFAAARTRIREFDGVLAGSLSTTGDVIRAALRGIGTAQEGGTLSSMFLMCFPFIGSLRESEFCLGFGDCAVLPRPTSTQLADIAISSAHTFNALTGLPPHIAMLSFSTKGSAHSESTERVLEALELAKQRAPELSLDGELQFDAAFIPEVAERKAKGSPVAGRANVFVFPDLDAGNIGYKIAERLGMGQAIGPVLQGLARPMNDLSRGAHVSDIVNMIAITALQSLALTPVRHDT